MKFSGVVSNTIEQLEGHDLYFELGERSVFQGSFKSLGLPDVLNTVFNIELQKAHFAPDDLASVYLPWFTMNIPVPSFLYKIPSVDFDRIRFDGTLSDFIVQAKSVTPALKGDLSFVYGWSGDEVADSADMRGYWNFEQINFGAFTGFPTFGYGLSNGEFKGSLTDEGLAFNLKAALPRLRVHNGWVKDVDIAATSEGKRLDLIATFGGGNVDGGFVSTYEMGDTLRFAGIKGDVKMDYPEQLGFGLRGGRESIETAFDLVYVGHEGKDFTNLTLSDIKYEGEAGHFGIDDISIKDCRTGAHHVTSLTSDVADLTLEGNYMKVQPMVFMKELIQNYLPAYALDGRKAAHQGPEYLEQFNFGYTVEFKDINRILKILLPDCSIAAGAKVVSGFDSDNGRLHLDFKADSVRYKEVCLQKAQAELTGNRHRLTLGIAADRLSYGQDYCLYNLKNEVTLANNHWDNRLSWCNWEKKTYSGSLAACVIFRPEEQGLYSTKIVIHPGVIVMDDSVWHVDASSVFVKGKELVVRDFAIRCGDEALSIGGRISEDETDELTLALQHFDLAHLARVALKKNPGIFGVTTGTLTLQDYYKDALLLSDFRINDWGIGQDTLGSLRMRSFWDAENRSLIMGAENRMQDQVSLSMHGFYKPETDTLNVAMQMKGVELERFDSYFSDFATDVSGRLSGNLQIKGKARLPDVAGSIVLDSVGMKINALNTHFTVCDSMRVADNCLLFDDFAVQDAKGNKAVLNGEYKIWQNKYKVAAMLDNLQVLNTGVSENEAFYGRVNLSGLAELDNSESVVNVFVNARTEPESQLNVPLTVANTEQASNFLHFVNAEQPELRKEQAKMQVAGINLNANLEVNDNLDVQVIFDPTVGDILKMSGNGNIKIAFDKDGSLSMFGEYGITKGDYLFTLSNLINKKFVLTLCVYHYLERFSLSGHAGYQCRIQFENHHFRIAAVG